MILKYIYAVLDDLIFTHINIAKKKNVTSRLI